MGPSRASGMGGMPGAILRPYAMALDIDLRRGILSLARIHHIARSRETRSCARTLQFIPVPTVLFVYCAKLAPQLKSKGTMKRWRVDI